MSEKKVVYFICNSDSRQALVSGLVWKALEEAGLFSPAGFRFDGADVMMHKDEDGNLFYFVPTQVPICADYPRYLPEMNQWFRDFDMSGMVTWHEGANAPEKVFTVHSLGDANSGVYGPANPGYMRNLLLALDRERIAAGFEDYTVTTEATHWSGIHAPGIRPELLLEFPVPMVDIEIGSDESSWSDPLACGVLARALLQVFRDDGRTLHNLLCVGGIHFDPNYGQAVFSQWDNDAFGISHIIANQWLVSGAYEQEQGISFARSAVEAIDGGIQGIVFHDKMKGCYKDLVRALGELYHVPIYKHQRLRNPDTLEW